jgi:hypothetical protein
MTFDTHDLTERRRSPRFEIDLDVDLVLENGTVLSSTSRNISSYGIQLNCDSWVTDEIEPRGIQNHTINQIKLKVIIDLPIKDTENSKLTNKLYTNCRILSVQRISQEAYMLNLSFIDFENGSESVLDAYIAQHQQNKIVVNPNAV